MNNAQIATEIMLAIGNHAIEEAKVLEQVNKIKRALDEKDENSANMEATAENVKALFDKVALMKIQRHFTDRPEISDIAYHALAQWEKEIGSERAKNGR